MAMVPFDTLSERIIHEVERCMVDNDGTAHFYSHIISELGVTLEYFASVLQDKVLDETGNERKHPEDLSGEEHG